LFKEDIKHHENEYERQTEENWRQIKFKKSKKRQKNTTQKYLGRQYVFKKVILF